MHFNCKSGDIEIDSQLFQLHNSVNLNGISKPLGEIYWNFRETGAGKAQITRRLHN